MKNSRFRLALILLLFGIAGPTAYAVTEDDKIVAGDAAAGDQFGESVTVSGTTVVVGARLDDDAGSQSGSAYVFDCSSFPCVQVSKLTASDAAAGDNFGTSVAVSGTTAVVGAPNDDDAGTESGSAYYFDLSACGAACTEDGKLTASDAALADNFGFSVAVSGTTAVVGAHGNDDGGSSSGSAYYFDLSGCGAACTESGKLTASDAAMDDFFGRSVAVSGTTAVVGAFRDGDAGSNSGSAYYFDLSSCGAACTEDGKLTASDAAGSDFFGASVAVSGTTAVVGAAVDDDAGTESGSAYYFDLSACGAACTESGKLTASDAAGEDQFGVSVAVSGTTAVVGAHLDDDAGTNSGSAYGFDLSACGAACTESGKLTASDAATRDRFGFSVAVSGTTAVVGAFLDDDAGGASGSAYVFGLMFGEPTTTTTTTTTTSTTTTTLTTTQDFTINAAISDAWFFPDTSGQGFFIIVWEDSKLVFLAWFTYDTERPPQDVTAILGEPGHRWLTALGPFDGDTALLDVFLSSGMIFDSAVPAVTTEQLEGATIEIVWSSCTEGVLKYDIPSLGLSGEISIQRIVEDNVAACEAAQAQ